MISCHSEAPDYGALTEAELVAVLRAFAETRGARCFTTQDATRVANWANECKVAEATLRLVLRGLLRVDVNDDGEIVLARAEDGR